MGGSTEPCGGHAAAGVRTSRLKAVHEAGGMCGGGNQWNGGRARNVGRSDANACGEDGAWGSLERAGGAPSSGPYENASPRRAHGCAPIHGARTTGPHLPGRAQRDVGSSGMFGCRLGHLGPVGNTHVVLNETGLAAVRGTADRRPSRAWPTLRSNALEKLFQIHACPISIINIEYWISSLEEGPPWT